MSDNRTEKISAAEGVYERLQGALRVFSARVRESATDAVCWTLPDPLDPDKQFGKGEFRWKLKEREHSFIEVKQATGGDAIDKCCSEFNRVVRWADQHPGFTIRRAGIVAVGDVELLELAEAVNRIKAELKDAMMAISEHHTQRRQMIRFSKLKDMAPLQAYRKLTVLPLGVRKIAFGWAGAPRTVSSTTKGEFIAGIRSAMGSSQRWEDQLAGLADDVALAVVKQQFPSPLANVWADEGATKHSAVTPFIVVSEQLPLYLPLLNYAAGRNHDRGPRVAGRVLEADPVAVSADGGVQVYRYRSGIEPKKHGRNQYSRTHLRQV